MRSRGVRQKLGVSLVLQGRADKEAALNEIVAATGTAAENACAVGDDLADLALFRRVGVRFAVADAVPELRAAADAVTMLPGGRGAAREVIETLLKCQGNVGGFDCRRAGGVMAIFEAAWQSARDGQVVKVEI